MMLMLGEDVSRYIDKHCRDNEAQLVEQFKFVCYLSKYVYNCLQIDLSLFMSCSHQEICRGNMTAMTTVRSLRM